MNKLNNAYDYLLTADYSDYNYKAKQHTTVGLKHIDIRPAATDKVHPNITVYKASDDHNVPMLLVEITHRTNTWCGPHRLKIYIDESTDCDNTGSLVKKAIERYMTVESNTLFQHLKDFEPIRVSRTKDALHHVCSEVRINIC